MFVGGVCIFISDAFVSVLLRDRGQFFLFIVADTVCVKGVENISEGLSTIYFKPFCVVPGRFYFI